MAFAADARVKVTSQNSEHRGRMGTVETVDGDNHQVRLDGHPVGKTVLLLTKELSSTTLESPVDYGD